MKENIKDEKQFIEEIEKIFALWEKENEERRMHHEKMKNENNKYFKEGVKTQKEYIANIEKVVKIKNINECEKFISDIAEDIPSHIVLNEAHPIMQELVEETSDRAKNLFDNSIEYSEDVKKVIPKKYRDRALKLEKEQKELTKKIEMDFYIMTECIAPLIYLSRDKWSFLWNLASWKFNAILTKQMRKYTFLVMILTVVVVVFALISILFQFLN